MVKQGQLRRVNLIGFLGFQLNSLLVMNCSWITIWFALMANINAGVITVIWSVTPLGVAIAEYFIFGQRLKRNYQVGMALIIICVVALSLN